MAQKQYSSAGNNDSVKKNKRFNIVYIIVLVVAAIIGLYKGVDFKDLPGYLFGDSSSQTESVSSQTKKEKVSSEPDEKNLQVYFLNVGQGDCEVAFLPNGQVMVIDAGNNSDGVYIASYLQQLGVEKINYLIGTHPHEDHIGGLDVLINKFDIGAIYMPRVADDQIPTTKTYEDILTAASQKNLKIKAGKAGMHILKQEELSIDFLAPTEERYEGLNEYSIVVRLTYGEKTFLFMGDAESGSEKNILQSGAKVSADVLKIGHHGSSSSSSQKFMEAVAPETAIISCGKNNDYGHPHKETLAMLKKKKIDFYRTDKDGSILATCDGKEIEFAKIDVDCDGNK